MLSPETYCQTAHASDKRIYTKRFYYPVRASSTARMTVAGSPHWRRLPASNDTSQGLA